MIQQGQAAALEWRLRRLGGEWTDVSVRYVGSRRALAGLVVTWSGRGFYLHRSGSWRWIGRTRAAASLRVGQLERGTKYFESVPPPTPAEVLGVVLQVVGAVLGLVRDVSR